MLIDEIQRLPSLFNTLQTLLDAKIGVRFFMAGSSARKLRRGNANLLPGRIFIYQLGPLTTVEMGDRFDLKRALATGCLPGIYLEPDSKTRQKLIQSYTAAYLREEVQAEALTRNVEGFARFLDVASAQSGAFVDLSKLSSPAAVPR